SGVHAERATVLQDGDEVALLIPVAGGTDMATLETRTARQTVFVDTFTDGLLGPDVPMLGPVANGGHIVVNTTPGCWGPMITPSIRGGHEVSTPVAVQGARVGDAI